MAENKINNVTPKEADTRTEKLLLGFLAKQCDRLNFGQISLDITIRDGKIYNIRSREIEQTFICGER